MYLLYACNIQTTKGAREFSRLLDKVPMAWTTANFNQEKDSNDYMHHLSFLIHMRNCYCEHRSEDL